MAVDQERRRRQVRDSQARKRGSVSWKTEYENALILLAWETGELSEGQAATALDVDRVEARRMLAVAKNKGAQLAIILK